MYCQKCGIAVSEESVFCLKCGRKVKSDSTLWISNKTLLGAALAALISVGAAMLTFFDWGKKDAIPPVIAAQTSPSPTPSSVAPVASPATIKVAVTPALTPTPAPISSPQVIAPDPVPKPVTQIIINEQSVLQAGSYRFVKFIVPFNYSHAQVSGYFQVNGGKNDIWVGIMDQRSFEDFSKGSAYYKLFYGENIVNVHQMMCTVRPGVYYLIFSNKHAVMTNKGVNAIAEMILFPRQ